MSDAWEYRALLYYLVWREIQGHYRQTALGISWLFIRPLANMAVLTLVFGEIVRVDSDGLPYALFSLSGLLPWGYFAAAVGQATGSLVGNMQLISKVYFPRILVPVAAVLAGVVDFLASLVVFLVVGIGVYRIPLRWEMLWVPVFLAAAMVSALAMGLWLATLSVRFRDVGFATRFLLQAMMYASPVIYSATLVPDRLQFAFRLNPMTGVIEGFRWALLGSGDPPGGAFLVSMLLVFLGLVGGAFVFRRTERSVVDVL